MLSIKNNMKRMCILLATVFILILQTTIIVNAEKKDSTDYSNQVPGNYTYDNKLIYDWWDLIDLGLIEVKNNCLTKVDYYVEGILIIPEGITSIGEKAVYDCDDLLSVKIPSTVKSIGVSAFENCNFLEEVYLSDGVKKIEACAFYECNYLDVINIPDSVTSIGISAFYGCTYLNSFEIPNSVENIGAEAFALCKELESVKIPNSITHIENYTFWGCELLSDVEIPDSVTSIGEGAFEDCSYLKSINIPNSVTSIGKAAFAFCNYAYVNVPSSVTYIGTNAFAHTNLVHNLSTASGSPWGADEVHDYAINNCPECGTGDGKPTLSIIMDKREMELYVGDKYTLSVTYTPNNVVGDKTISWSSSNEKIAVVSNGLVKAVGKGECTITAALVNGKKAVCKVIVKEEGTEYIGTFSFLNGEGTGDTTLSLVDYKDSYFTESSYQYNHQLAKMSLCMALASFNAKDGNYYAVDPEKLSIENKLETKAGNAVELLLNCGFEEDSITLNNAYLKAPQEDSIGVVLAKKKINDETLIAVVVRGGGYEKEWASNFNIYNTGDEAHPGFQSAANQVNQTFEKFISDQNITGDIKVWIMGYSRGAATANLVAAYLNDVAEMNAVVSFEKKDIYAYTFETPQNTKSIKAKNSTYANIFNIINPIDIVTKVTMSDWGYTRYGTDMYIPSRDTKSGYKDLVLPVLNSYNAFTNKFHLYLPEIASQSYILDKALSGTASALGSDSTQTTKKISELLQDKMKNSSTKSDEDLLKEAMEILKIEIPWSFKLFYNQTVKQIIQGHYPEMCLAWMYNLDDYVFDTNELIYRLVHVNCPVDVNVYSKDGVLVASIKDNSVLEVEGSYISAFVDENEQKIVCLPADEEYEIEIIATDDGNMTYTVSEYDATKADETKVVSYYDVEIKEGEILHGDVAIPVEEETNYTLVHEKGEILEPTIIKKEEEINNYTVDITSIGAGNVDVGGIYREGEFCKINAVADEGAEFKGWYAGDELLSTEAEYRFRVEKDITIEARFTYYNITECVKVSGLSNKVYNGKNIVPDIQLKHNEYTLIKNIDYKVEALNNLKPGKATVTILGIGKYTGVKKVYFNIVPKKVQNFTAVRYQYGNQIRLYWSKATGASGYRIEYKKPGAKKYTFLANTKNLYYTKGGLVAKKTYKFKVTPYVVINNTKYYSTATAAYRATSIATVTKGKKLVQVAKPTVTKSGTKVKVKWKNVANETGYQISKSTSKTGTNIVATYATKTGTSKLISATKGKTYYYKVRAYRTVNGKKIFGAWSTAVKYKR